MEHKNEHYRITTIKGCGCNFNYGLRLSIIFHVSDHPEHEKSIESKKVHYYRISCSIISYRSQKQKKIGKLETKADLKLKKKSKIKVTLIEGILVL